MLPVSCCIFCSGVIAASSSLARRLATASFALSVAAASARRRWRSPSTDGWRSPSSEPPPQATRVNASAAASADFVPGKCMS